MVLAMRAYQILGWDLDAKVDHIVAIVFQNDLDEILADVVNIALHRGEDDPRALFDVRLLHESFEMADGGFHGLGGLKNFGDNQFVVVEKPAHFRHSIHQRPVDDVQRRHALLQLEVQVADQPVFRAFEDVIRKAAIQREIFRARLLADARSAKVRGNCSDMELIDGGLLFARLRPPIIRRAMEKRGLGMPGRDFPRHAIEKKILGKQALMLGDRRETLDALGVDDSQIESSLRAVVEKDGIHNLARTRRQAEGYVRDSQHGSHVGNALLNETNSFNCLHGAADVIFIPGGAGKHKRIENDAFRANTILLGEHPVRALGNFQLSLARERLRLNRILVNAAHDDGSAVRARKRADALEFLLAIFQIDRVDDALSLAIGERELNGARVRGINHYRDFDLAYEIAVEVRDIIYLIAVRALQANVHDVRAALHLAPRDFGGFLPLFLCHEVLERPRADHVRALSHHERARALFGFDHFDPGVDRATVWLGRAARRLALRHLRECANVMFRCSAAPADDIEPAPIHKSLELFGERRWRLPISPFLIGQACIGIAGNKTIREELQRADMVGHELGAGGAVQAQRNHFHVIERGPKRLDALATEHRSHGLNRRGNHQRDGLAKLA